MIDHPAGDRGSLELLDQAVKESDNNSEAQAILQRKLAKPILDRFRPSYDKNPGRDGMVSLQGDPICEHDPNVIFAEGLANRALSDNVCVKVPVTAPGLKAIEALIEEGVPVNATEIFAVSQAITLCDLYDEVTQRCGKSPTIFLSHIAGIYDDYLKDCMERTVLWSPPIFSGRQAWPWLARFIGSSRNEAPKRFSSVAALGVCITSRRWSEVI
jgi:transaldolase